MEYLTEAVNEIFDEICELRETQGLLSRENYFELIDEILEIKRGRGELSDDFNFGLAREALRGRWPEVEQGISNV